MKLIAIPAVLLAVANQANSEERFLNTVIDKWTSHPNYEACAAGTCQRKYYTVTNVWSGMKTGDEVVGACDGIGAYPFCPESNEESEHVFSHLAMAEYKQDDGNLNIIQWAIDMASYWSGVRIKDDVSGHTKEFSDHYCAKELKSQDHATTYPWDSSKLTDDVFNWESENEKDGAKCVAVNEAWSFLWGHVDCTDPRPQPIHEDHNKFKRRTICVTTQDKSGEMGYEEMNLEAKEWLEGKLSEISWFLWKAFIIFWSIIITIFSGCCFCCCCCMCKPCSKKQAPVVIQQQVPAAAPVAAPMPGAPAPAQYMPPAPAPAQPAYGQPMQQPMQQPAMGGINMNISNNNTNTNKN